MGDSPSPVPTTDLAAMVAALTARVDALEAERARLGGAPPPRVGAVPPDAPHGPPTPGSGSVGRRAVIAGAAGLAAAGAAAVVAAPPAAASNGEPLVLGSASNLASEGTGLAVIGTDKGYGIGVTDNGLDTFSGSTAVLGHATGQAFDNAVQGLASGTATAVFGLADSGLAGRFLSPGPQGDAVVGSGARYGVVCEGGSAPLIISPQGSGALSTSSHGAALATLGGGGVGFDLWFAIDGIGVTGSARWRKVVGSKTAGAFHLLPTPVRVYDSRPGTVPAQGPKTPLPAGNVARTIDLKVNGSTVPAGATGALLTILLTNAANGAGNLTVWANDKAKPAANSMVWGGSAGRFTATATTAVDAQARIKVDASLQTNVVIDVVGYFQ